MHSWTNFNHMNNWQNRWLEIHFQKLIINHGTHNPSPDRQKKAWLKRIKRLVKFLNYNKNRCECWIVIWMRCQHRCYPELFSGLWAVVSIPVVAPSELAAAYWEMPLQKGTDINWPQVVWAGLWRHIGRQTSYPSCRNITKGNIN